jgi:hypothetical protein
LPPAHLLLKKHRPPALLLMAGNQSRSLSMWGRGAC